LPRAILRGSVFVALFAPQPRLKESVRSID
jgi:hypothetical protein